MKTIPPICNEPETGPKYWRSLEQLADQPDFRQWMEREFPAGASIAPDGETRRDWMKLMSASFLLAGLGGMATGCRRPEEELTPFAKQPEGFIHGKAQHFATSMPVRGSAIPLTVKSSDGRPTKIEGNSLFPGGNGGTDSFAQAAILNLYDPDRAHRHTKGGNDARIEAVRDALAAVAKAAAGNQGEGLAFLAERSSSPSRARLQKLIAEKYPKSSWHAYEPVDFSGADAAYSQACGSPVHAVVHLEKARRILSLDADFIGSEQDAHRNIRGFALGRKSADDGMNRLYVVESMMSLTGGNADHRLRVKPSEVVQVAAAVAAELGVPGVASTSGAHSAWAGTVAKDLKEAGKAAVVVAGYSQPPAVHALAAAINAALGAIGTTVSLVQPTEPAAQGISELAGALQAGKVSTLVVLGGNPAYNAPADLQFETVARKAGTVIRLGYYEDETAALATWHLAGAHFLESWGDARTADGTVVPVQPLVEPLFGGLTELEVLARILGEAKTSPYDIVRETLKGLGVADDAAWKRFLHDGFLDGSAAGAVAATVNPSVAATVLAAHKPAQGEFEVVLHRDASVDDGRFANNGWLQEMPDPITKVTWDNVVMVSQKTAKALGLPTKRSGKVPENLSPAEAADAKDGQYDQPVVKITVGGRSVEGPVWVQPGLADGTVALGLGYGRRVVGRVGRGVGFNAYALLQSASGLISAGKVEKVFRKHRLAVTQEHGLMEGRPVIREAHLDQFKAHPEFARNMDLDAHLPHYVPYKKGTDGRNAEKRPQNIYEHPYDQNPETASKIHQWGMVIDLQTCVGCSACVIACQSENNIPIVGKDQVARGREMLWMRIDRYYSHNPDADVNAELAAEDPQMAVQPMFCQHCEAAPCESVCPVNATVHDEEGINAMAYNRCIGTRYCANNCPYKVRRFNWFDFNKRETDYGAAQDQHLVNTGNLYKGPLGVNRNTEPEWEIIKLVKNPDVTVRMRGVMEKCTLCVQRIQQGKIAQKVKAGNSGDVAVPDGAIKTACQQACPADAIVFGNMLDARSEVVKAKASPRNYSVLGFLDTRPRVTYLARIRNPNPAILALEKRKTPDSQRDYERFRHETPFQGHSHGHDASHPSAAAAGKGAI
jgi:molybdopterin-containing oxidoreductase family iron-sulfur binding subunit